MALVTITGRLIDSDGIAWRQATWTAVPVSPSSKPVFPNGQPVPTTSGVLDDLGTFSGQVPQTITILPPGTTLTFTIYSLTSAPPLTIAKVQIIPSTTIDLGALLSPLIAAPRIKAAAIIYAYSPLEVVNPIHGNGYVNTTGNQSFIYMQSSWQPIGASINPADVAYLSKPNQFTRQNDFAAGINIEGGTLANGPIAVGGGVSAPLGSPLFFTDATGLPISFHSGGAQIGQIDSLGNAQFSGYSWAGTNISAGVDPSPPTAGNCRTYAAYLFNQSIYTKLYCCGDGGTPGQLQIWGMSPGGAGLTAAAYATFNTAGLHVTGDISATTKSFKITHPLDESKLLIHACLEGPENGVYYRGEAELVDGRAIVELPDYFEALTAAGGRSVLLTQIDEGGELAIVAASRVVDGKFSIRSNVSAALVSWEVKAVRRDVGELVAEQAKRGERSENES